jgi:hypothetical protein
LKQTREVRVFRRACAVRDVVKGQRIQHVSGSLLSMWRGETAISR